MRAHLLFIPLSSGGCGGSPSSLTGFLLFGWGACRAEGPGKPFLLTTPSSLPSPLPPGKLKSELDMLVGKCPEEPLEGDMSSPNSTGTQVRGRAGLSLWDLSKTKLAPNDPKSVSLALGSPAGDAGWEGGPGGET